MGFLGECVSTFYVIAPVEIIVILYKEEEKGKWEPIVSALSGPISPRGSRPRAVSQSKRWQTKSISGENEGI